MTTTTYIPGMCNIGPAEIKTRKMAGRIGVILTVVLFVVMMALGFSPALRLIIFIPATLGAMGYLQAALHFCIRFGTTGLFNVSDSLGKVENVDQKEYRRKDQRKAVSIAGFSLLIGAAVAIIVFLLP